jgi:hypothetical protein
MLPLQVDAQQTGDVALQDSSSHHSHGFAHFSTADAIDSAALCQYY